MRRGWLNRATMLSLVLALFVSGCDHAPTEPDINVPEQAQTEQVEAPVISADAGYHLVRADVGGGDTSQGLLGGLLRLVGQVLTLVVKIIGLDGGLLTLGSHSLLVPAGAVTEPTTFSMELLKSQYVMVDLTAMRRGEDVGEKGFDKPVTVTLSYEGLRISDPSKLFILRINENGQHEKLPSVVDSRKKTVSAELDHFSKYAMASN
jgi:hypothetical protein